MYKLCKTEQSSKRQRELERSLLSLMNQKPYAEISITELCENIPIPRKAFYRYFDSKDDALKGMIEHTLTEYYTYSTPTTGAKRSLMRELSQFFDFWRSKHDFLDAIEKNQLTGLLIDLCVQYPIDAMIKIERFLPNDPESTRRSIFRFATIGLLFHMLEWYRTGFMQPIDEMARSTMRLLCHPLFSSLSDIGFDEEEWKGFGLL